MYQRAIPDIKHVVVREYAATSPYLVLRSWMSPSAANIYYRNDNGFRVGSTPHAPLQDVDVYKHPELKQVTVFIRT